MTAASILLTPRSSRRIASRIAESRALLRDRQRKWDNAEVTDFLSPLLY